MFDFLVKACTNYVFIMTCILPYNGIPKEVVWSCNSREDALYGEF